MGSALVVVVVVVVLATALASAARGSRGFFVFGASLDNNCGLLSLAILLSARTLRYGAIEDKVRVLWVRC